MCGVDYDGRDRLKYSEQIRPYYKATYVIAKKATLSNNSRSNQNTFAERHVSQANQRRTTGDTGCSPHAMSNTVQVIVGIPQL